MMTVSLSSGRPATYCVPRLPDDLCGLHESPLLCTDVVDPVRAKRFGVRLPLRLRFLQPLALSFPPQPSARAASSRDRDFLLSNVHKTPDFLRDFDFFYFRF